MGPDFAGQGDGAACGGHIGEMGEINGYSARIASTMRVDSWIGGGASSAETEFHAETLFACILSG